jgi:beta-lactamase regulating signal transducer with metallopeptidase domain
MITLVYLLKVHAAFTVLVVLYYAVFRRTRLFRANRFTLLFAAVLSFALPLLPAVYSPAAPESQAVTFLGNNLANAVFKPVVTDQEGRANQPVALNSHPPVPLFNILAFLYASGAAFMLLRVLQRLWLIRKVIRRSRRQELEGKAFYSHALDLQPFSFLRFIVIPQHLTGAALRQVILHEGGHSGGSHTLDVLLAELVVALLWINPLAYAYRRLVRLNLEYLADEHTLRQGIDPGAYQLNLLNIARSHRHDLPAPAFASLLRQRVRAMNAPKPRLLQGTRYVLLVPVLFLLSVLTGFKGGEVLPKAPRAMPVPVTSSKAGPAARTAPVLPPPVSKPAVMAKAVQARPAAAEPGTNEPVDLKPILVDARTDTVRFRYGDEPGPAYKGIYVVDEKVYLDGEIREVLEATGSFNIPLKHRPALIVYTKDDASAIARWGDKAREGAIVMKVGKDF